MDNKELLESISKRLGVLIALQMTDQTEARSVTGGVEILTRLGLQPSEIADILNKSVNTVNVTRTRLKKNKKS